jgi:ABC-type transport system substrate-binding protein
MKEGNMRKMNMLMALAVVVLAVVMAFAPAVSAAKVERLIFASAGFSESNRFWTVGRPDLLQFDPFLETLLDVDPKTGKFIPRLAERWESSPDAKEWTFYLRKGVQFHYGYGEMTARDVIHSHQLSIGPEARSTFMGLWRQAEEVKALDDYTVVFRMKEPAVTFPYAASRSGDLRIVSKAQWDQEGVEGFDKRPAGTGSYRYVSRTLGQSILYERVDDHWGGEKPDFKELEIRLEQEEATRLALLLSGKAHLGDLSRQLQADALRQGLKVVSSQLPIDWLSVYMGGQYYIPGDPAYKAGVPWHDKRVRQALNMSINRAEMLDAIFQGKGKLVYVSCFDPTLEGWNPDWATQFETQYGYNPEKAKALLKEAGYPPGKLKIDVLGFQSPGEEELPQVAESLSLFFHEVGVETEVQIVDWARIRGMTRNKAAHGAIWPNLISIRPIQEWIRVGYYSQGTGHMYEDEFIEKKYLDLAQNTDAETRDKLAREIGDHLFAQFPDIPLFWLFNEIVVDPKVVAEWTYPGTGGGRTTHFHLLKAAQ